MSASTPGTPLPFLWYHGSITRLHTEECLMRANKTGSFLVRDSESFKGAYVLSVMCDGRIYQYRILPDGNNKYLIKSSVATKQHTFSNIPELIESYKIKNNGLCCPLLYPATEATKVEAEEEQDSDDDEEETDGSSSAIPTDGALNILQSRLESLSLGSMDSQFLERVQDYVGSKAKQDLEDVKGGATTANNLRKLVVASAKDLTRQVDLFLSKVEILQQLFELSCIPKIDPAEQAGKTGSDLKQLFSRLGECQARVTTLENKAVATFQELSNAPVPVPAAQPKQEQQLPDIPDLEPPTYMGGGNISNGTDTLKAATPTFQAMPFEVKVEGLTVHALKSTKVKLTVDVSQGSLAIMKHYGKDMKEEMTSFTHDKIIQLIKSRGTNTKLQIRFSNGKKKEYSFEDAKKRETFCQLIQYMKMMHSNSKELDQISVFIGTWNMGAAMPPTSITSWLTCQGDGKTRDPSLAAMRHDIYVIGTQEFKSAAISDKDWVNRIKMEIGRLNGSDLKEYVAVSLTSLWGLRLSVLVSPDHEHRISHVRDSFVRTGIANTLGNKGAVGVSFLFNGTSFCFINAHLTSGTEKCTRRNNNYHDIIRGLSLSSKGLSLLDLTNQFHHIFFLGDLNYRIEWNVPDIIRNIDEKEYDILFDHEQLKREKDQNKIFVDFDEEEIMFPPTYRYRIGDRSVYDYKKVKKTMVRINEPSWCDRVIWRSYPGTHIANTSYGCTTDITTSDHSPVFATFDVGISATTVVPKGMTTATQNAKIVFVSAEAIINTSMCGLFYLEFSSNCLEAGTCKSGVNKTCLQEQMGSKLSQIRPSWSSDDLPKLNPLLSDFDYLEEQHIHVAIKSSESEESYGGFVVSLKDKISSSPVAFHAVLTHHGHRTGEISGSLHVKARDESLYGGCRKTKTYELVSFEEKDKDKAEAMLSPAKGKPRKFPWGKVSGMESPATDISNALLNPVTRRRPNGELGTTIKLSKDASQASCKDDEDDEHPPPLPPPRRGPATPDVVPSDDSKQLKPPKHLPLDKLLVPESGKPSLRQCLSSPGDADFMLMTRSRSRSPQTLTGEDRPLPQPPPEDDETSDLLHHSSMVAALPAHPKKPARRQSPGKVLQLRAQFEQKSSSSSEGGSPETAKSFIEEAINKPPLPKRTASDVKSMEDAVLIEGLPPPLPAKSKTPPKNQMSDLEEYEVLRRPSTIMEWLMNLGLPHYGYQLLTNGWDNVSYLDMITNKDLLDCQVDDRDHRQRMLWSIQNMPQSK